MKDKDFMLTTTDNPFDPHENYNSWDRWDRENGYHTAEYLARLVDLMTGHEKKDLTDEEVIKMAMWQILLNDTTNTYVFI